MTRLFVRFRAGDWMDLKATGIKGFCDPLNIASFSGCVPAFISNDHRHTLAVQTVMQFAQLLLEMLQLFLVFFILDHLVCQFDFRKLRHFLKRKNVWEKRCAVCAVLQGYLNVIYHYFKNLKFYEVAVFCINNIPWCNRSIRICQIAVENLLAMFVMFVLPLVKGIHTPFCILLFVKLLNTSGLLFFVNLHEKFQNQITVVCELSLEMFDAVDPLCIILFFQTIQTVFAGLLHPARIQKGKFAGFRNLIEIPVQKWSAQFILCRL